MVHRVIVTAGLVLLVLASIALPLPGRIPNAYAAGRLSDLVFATDESGGRPTNPAAEFAPDTKRMYGFFKFRGLAPTDAFTGRWYQGDRLLYSQTYTLRDAFPGVDRPPTRGDLWVFFHQEDSFVPGDYRLEVQLNGETQDTAMFHIEAPAGVPLFTDLRFADAAVVTEDNSAPLAALYDVDTGAHIAAVWNSFNMGHARSWGYLVSHLGEPVIGRTDLEWTGRPDGRATVSFDAPTAPGIYDTDLYIDGTIVPGASASFVVQDPLVREVAATVEDDFSVPGRDWSPQHESDPFVGYRDGMFVTQVTTDGGLSVQKTELDEAVIEVDATPDLRSIDVRVTQDGEYEEFAYYGLVVRYRDNRNLYAFLTSTDGGFGLVEIRDGTARPIIQSMKAVEDLIPSGVATRRFRALLLGQLMRFYVNDRLVYTVADAGWVSGRAGVAAQAGDRAGEITIDWDNWKVWQPGAAPAGPAQPAAARDTGASAQTSAPAAQPTPARTQPGLAAAQETPGIQLDTATWVPRRDASYGWWGAVAAGTKPEGEFARTAEADQLDLPPGRYDVYWAQGFEQREKPMLIASGVEVGEQGTVSVRAASGLQLTTNPDLPKLDPSYGWWGAVRAGGLPKDAVNWTNKDSALLLPPGDYDVYWAQGFDQRERPLLLAAGLVIEEGVLEPLEVTSGLKTVVSSDLPKRDPSYGWWGAVKVGDTPDTEHLINWTKADDAIIVLPGTYDVYWAQGFEQREQPMLIAEAVEASNGELTEVNVDSGARIEVAPHIPRRDASYGWWGAIRAYDKVEPDRRVNWTNSDDAILLPPGDYDFFWVQGFDQREKPLLIEQTVTVAPGQIASVKLTSGARIDVAPDIPPRDTQYGWWGAVVAGDSPTPDRLINWNKTDEVIALWPGRFDFYWVQGFAQRERPMLIAKDVNVREDDVVSVPARSGVRFNEGSAGSLGSGGWWGLVPAGQDTEADLLNWTDDGSISVLLAPPGRYDLLWKDASSDPRIVKRGVIVTGGQITEVKTDLS